MSIDILGVGFDSLTAEQAVLRAIEVMRSGKKAYIVTPNPEIVWKARRGGDLLTALNNAWLVLPDGIGIILAAKILGRPLRSGRVPGIDFAESLLKEMAETGGRVFLLGAKPGIATEAGEKLADKYHGLIISGATDGYFTDAEAAISQINQTPTDLVLVCLGSPKQELWMAEYGGRLNASLCIGLGGSLDVFAGKTKRAPAFFRRFGVEWLYRLIREPYRIKRMIKLPLFVLAVLWTRIIGSQTDVEKRSLRGRNG